MKGDFKTFGHDERQKLLDFISVLQRENRKYGTFPCTNCEGEEIGTTVWYVIAE